MTHAIALGHQVADVVGVGPHRQRHALDDVQAVPIQTDALGRVVGEQPHRPDAEVDEDLRTDAVVAGVRGQAQLEVGVDGVVAGVLQLIGLQLVQQADAAALVTAHVEHHAAALAGDHRHRGVELGTAVTPTGTEHVAGEALRVHAHEHVVPVGPGAAVRIDDVAANQGHVLDVVVHAGVADGPELAVPGGDASLGDALDVLLVLAAPLDEVGDRDEREVVFVGEDPQLVGLRHGAFVLLADDLADRARRLQARQPGQVDGCLGVAGPAQHATVLGAQRDDVTGLGEVVGDRGRIGQRTHRGGTVGGRDAGSDTDFRVHGDGVGGAVLVLVHGVHRQQSEPVADVPGEWNAQVARGVPDHEGDEFRGRLLGGEDQVALVLAILIVDDDHGLTSRNVGYRPFDGIQPRHLLHLLADPNGNLNQLPSV